MPPEFDDYAEKYNALLKDPLRDRFARDPEFFHRRKWLLLHDFLIRRGAAPGSLSWLDVGCGQGELLRCGHDFFRSAIGCDPSKEMLKRCHGLHVEHQIETALLPFAERSFDLLTAACVYHHLSKAEQRSLTAEAARVLRPGGTFVLFEHNPWNPVTRRIVSRTPVDANAVLLTGRETRQVITAAGLQVLELRYYLYLPEPLFARFQGAERLLAALPAGGQYAAFAARNA